MNLAVDVQYDGDSRAVAAGILFPDWRSDVISRVETVTIDTIAPYRPGAFYERELPCIRALLDRIGERSEVIIIDGYVTLGADARDGLGAHLHAALGGAIPIIGVAKSRFAGTPAEMEVYRGASRQPLYVTSRGIDSETARGLIAGMHGPHRMPTLLGAVDRVCRAGLRDSGENHSDCGRVATRINMKNEHRRVASLGSANEKPFMIEYCNASGGLTAKEI